MGLLGKLLHRNESDDEKDLQDAMSNSQAGEDFSMRIEDTFALAGGGLVVVGKVASGTLTVGDTVRVNGRQTTVAKIEIFRKSLQTASAGDNVGICLCDLTKDDVKPGDMLTSY